MKPASVWSCPFIASSSTADTLALSTQRVLAAPQVCRLAAGEKQRTTTPGPSCGTGHAPPPGPAAEAEWAPVDGSWHGAMAAMASHAVPSYEIPS
eukprot:scaffold12827_cov68-Phaeocystis_antarctica.AAC.2